MSQVGVAILAIGEAEGALVSAIDQDPELTVVRRCADLPEVHAAIQAGVAKVAVIDTQDPDLDATMVMDLKQSHAIVILLAGLTQAAQSKTWGADGVAQPSAPASVVESIRAALRGQTQPGIPGSEPPPPPMPPSAGDSMADSLDDSVGERQHSEQAPGMLVAVWGTSGAPGRSSVALMLAASLSSRYPTLLIDADTSNPSLNVMVGLEPDAVGMGALARLAHRGQLTSAEIARAATPVGGQRGQGKLSGLGGLGDQLGLISGLSSAQRFRELSVMSLHQILTQAKSCAAMVVVDCSSGSGDPVEPPGEHRPTTRDEQVAEVLRSADFVVIVGRGDVLGIERLEHAFAWWKDLELDTHTALVVNRVSTLTAGARPANAVAQSLMTIAGGSHVWVLPEDPQVSSALLHGVVPQSGKNNAAGSVAQLAAEIQKLSVEHAQAVQPVHTKREVRALRKAQQSANAQVESRKARPRERRQRRH